MSQEEEKQEELTEEEEKIKEMREKLFMIHELPRTGKKGAADRGEI